MVASSTASSAATARFILLAVLVCLALAAAPAAAQEPASINGRSALHAVADVARHVATDPTTYAPAAILFTSMRLDWNSSQPLFRQGFVEDNPRYTLSGVSHDRPVSYGAGNRQLLLDSLAILPTMAVNNAVSRFGERALITNFPNHLRLIHALGWIERISFSAYLSYHFSAGHFAQWQRNKHLAQAFGAQ